MPEGLEAEIWREASTPLVGRRITTAWVDDRVAPPEFAHEVIGSTIVGVRRHGKILLLDTHHRARLRQVSAGPGLQEPDTNGERVVTIGVHFGMTGRLVVDGRAPIERLEYASGRDDPAWDRLVVGTDPSPGDGPALRFNDPRRLGHVSLDPDLSHLGVDVFRVTARRLAPVLARRRTALKIALLDQTVVAGLGNLLADEVLWWSGLSPRRRVDTLGADDVQRLVATIRRRLPVMLRRGGSTTGTLDPTVRAACPPCPRDGTPLRRDTIGHRTAVWCPGHQR